MTTREKRSIIRILVAIVLWLSSFGIIFWFTSYSGEDSSRVSMAVARFIRDLIARNFYVNPHDEFWDITLHAMIRKLAHYTEFFYHGITTGFLMVTLIKKKWISFSSSVFICLATAAFDEYRQRFIPGRGPQWSDVLLDATGALTGLLVFFLVYAVCSRIRSLKRRIRELENSVSK